MNIEIPQLVTDNIDVNKAFRIAYSDLVSNIVLYKDGLLEKEELVLQAGLRYSTPWTRDASINVWNGCGLLFPQVSKNTLLSVLIEDKNGLRVGGEYWDAIIWVTGVWYYYLYTGDKEFLEFAYKISENTIKYFEETEFDEKINLFRGPACYGDGVAAYPDIYAKSGKSGIISFTDAMPEYKAEKGVGIPMFALSTNCLYYSAYKTMLKIAEVLKVTPEDDYENKAENLKNAINKHFWMEDKGYYKYIVDDFGDCDYQEGMGHSFAILFGVADNAKTKKILDNQYITEHGIACVWPSFERYLSIGENEFGRHSGVVWPHIGAFWAQAAAENGRFDLMQKEFEGLTQKSIRDGHFAEIYHPVTGEMYGGWQENQGNGMMIWKSQLKQCWCASGYIRIMLFAILGISFDNHNMYVNPKMGMFEFIELSDFVVRGKKVKITVKNNKVYINDKETNKLNLD